MKTKYIVHKANIKDDEGVKRVHGDVVALRKETAKRYAALGFLRPYFGDDDEATTENKPSDDGKPSVSGREREPGGAGAGEANVETAAANRKRL